MGVILSLVLSGLMPVTHRVGTDSTFSHILIILMENMGIQDICGRSPPPCHGANTHYMSLLANKYGIASQYTAITHPSLPNYVALLGGDTFSCIKSCPPLPYANLVDRLEATGLTWKGYIEDYSGGCHGANLGAYDPDHNPFAHFQDILNNTARCNRIVNAGTGDSALLTDLASNATAPNYMWLAPNDCDNMDDPCGGQPLTGDDYLAGLVTQILDSTVFRTTNAALFITFDEGNGYCPLNRSNEDCLYTVWAGPTAKKAFSSPSFYNHYSLLATLERVWNLEPLTSNDGAASPMTEFLSPLN